MLDTASAASGRPRLLEIISILAASVCVCVFVCASRVDNLCESCQGFESQIVGPILCELSSYSNLGPASAHLVCLRGTYYVCASPPHTRPLVQLGTGAEQMFDALRLESYLLSPVASAIFAGD